MATRGSSQMNAIMARKVAEGDARFKEAEKHAKTSIKKWKPDWASAARLYQDAGLLFKTAKSWEKAKVAYFKSAHAHRNINNLYIAGANLEAAAFAARELKQFNVLVEYVDLAGVWYRENGNGDRAAELFTKAGRLIASFDVTNAIRFFEEAIEVYESEDKEILAGDAYKLCVSTMVTATRYDEAVLLMRKHVSYYEKKENFGRLYQLFIQIVVLLLHMGDFDVADETFQDYLHITGFHRSEQGKILNRVMEACERQDEEAMEKLRLSPQFNFMDPGIARIAKRLQIPPNAGSRVPTAEIGEVLSSSKTKSGGQMTTTRMGNQTGFVYRPASNVVEDGDNGSSPMVQSPTSPPDELDPKLAESRAELFGFDGPPADVARVEAAVQNAEPASRADSKTSNLAEQPREEKSPDPPLIDFADFGDGPL